MDAAVIYGALTALGTATGAGLRELWSFFRKRTDGESNAKDVTIAILQTELRGRDVVIAAKDKLIERLGAEKDAVVSQLEKERLQTLGVAFRMRFDSTVDEEDFEPNLPTTVRNMLALTEQKKSDPPKADEFTHLKDWDPTAKTPVPEG